MRRSILFLVFLIFILIILSFGFWLYQAKYFVGRANVSQEKISLENSYLFVSPLRARANGEEKIRTTVFVLDSRGLGVYSKKVSLKDNPDLTIDIVQGLTDRFGKAIFDVSAKKEGEYYLDVSIEAATLPQKAHLTFY